VPGPEADDLAAVVDRFLDAEDRAGAGFFFEGDDQVLLDDRERVAVGGGGLEGVVVKFAGDAGLEGGSLDESEFAVGGQKGLLALCQLFRHVGLFCAARKIPSLLYRYGG